MTRDNELIFATAQSPTTTNTALSTNVLDTGPLAASPFANTGRDLGSGEPLYLEIVVTTSGLSAATASQINFQLITAGNVGMTSPTVLIESAATSATSYVATSLSAAIQQTRIILPLPPAPGLWKQYVAVNCQITLGVLSALAYSAWITLKPSSYRAYAPGFKLDA